MKLIKNFGQNMCYFAHACNAIMHINSVLLDKPKKHTSEKSCLFIYYRHAFRCNDMV